MKHDMTKSSTNEANENEVVIEIRERLFSLADEKYKEFQSALMPSVDKNKVIGVRTPLLRAVAKEMRGSAKADIFMKNLPHKYYEEDNLHAFLLDGEKNYDIAVKGLKDFLPYVDNWATCDSMRIAAFEKNTEQAEKFALSLLDSPQIYEVRFGIDVFIKYFTGDRFDKLQADKIAAIRTNEYYVYMSVAWYFATLLTKRYEDALPYIEENKLDEITHNIAISKARDSRAIPRDRKDYLKGLKRQRK